MIKDLPHAGHCARHWNIVVDMTDTILALVELISRLKEGQERTLLIRKDIIRW